MTQQTKSGSDNVPAWPFAFPNMPDLWRVQSPCWLEGQAELSEESRKMMVTWAKRRQDGVAAYVRLLQDFGSCRDFGAVATAYGEWLDSSMKRVIADLNDARHEALRLAEIAQKTATAFSPNGAEAAKLHNATPHRAAAK